MKGACIALIARYGAALLLVVLAALGPFLLSQFNLLQLSSFAAMGLVTLGLALAWGYVGILSFGHAAFFGLGAYAYAIAAINLATARWRFSWLFWCRPPSRCCSVISCFSDGWGTFTLR